MAITRPTLKHGTRGPTYVENAAPVLICTDLVIRDPNSLTLSSATVRIGSGFEAGHDFLSFTDQNGISGSYDSASGTLTLTGVASVDDYQAALQSVTYFYDGEAPMGRSRGLVIVVNDGTFDSLGSNVRIAITAVPDPSVLTVDPSIIYTTFQQPIVVDPTLGLTDVDSGDRAAYVTITNYVEGQDVLDVVDTRNLHGIFHVKTGQLEIHGRGTAAEYEQLLRSVTYTNTSATPDVTPRVLTFVVVDSTGVSSNAGAVTVTLAAPPELTTSGTTVNYTEGDPATTLEPSLTLSDIDDPDMASATVTISSGFDAGDLLIFTDTANITGSYDALTGVLTLTGIASQAEYQAALRSVQFQGTTDDPVTSKTITWLVNDGSDGNSDPVTTTIAVTPVNDAPAVTDGDTLSYTENDATSVIAPNATITDPDSPDFSGGTLTVSFTANGAAEDQLTIIDQGTGAGQIGVSGSDVTYEGTVIGTFSGGANGADLVIALTSGAATPAAVQALMRDIGYTNTSEDPSTAARTVGFTLVDGDGTANGGVDTGTASATINVTSVNDVPVITTGGTPAAYTEGGAAIVLDGAIALSDLDDTTLTSATIAITAGFDAGDSLVFADTPNISGAYDPATGILTLTGTDTVANYEAALRSIQFLGTSDDPTTSKTVSWTVNDGTDDSATQTTTIGVTPVNDAPALSISDTLAYTENGAAAAIAIGATIGDPDSADFNGGSLTVGFTANGTAFDQLAIGNQGTGAGQIGVSGSDITYEGALIGTFSGGANGANLAITFTTSAATQAAVQALVRDITYSNSSDDPSTAARTVGYTLVDGDGTANSGADTGTASATINVTAVNDAPTVSTSGSTSFYTEGGADATVNGTLALADVDDTNLESATVSISGNFQAGDALLFTNQNGISGSYNPGTGVLLLTGTATVAQYEAALRSVTFLTTNDDPATTKTVSWVVNDGTDSSSTQTSTVNVIPVNDAPTLSISDTLAYTENGAAAAIAPGATISDPDSADFNGGSLSVAFTANGSPFEQLAIGNQGTGAGQIGVSGSNVTYGGVTIGTFSGGANGTGLVVTFTSSAATQAAVQALVRDITYSNSSDNPSTAARTVGYTLVDGDGTAIGGADTGTASATINVTAVNDAPTVSPSGTGSYTEGGAAGVVNAALTLADVDDTNLESATVSITGNFQAGDALVFSTQNGISGSYNAGTGELLLTGTSSVANYQAALRSITFQTTNDDPATTRTVSWVVSDGTDSSSTQTSTINVTRVNDAPVLSTANTLAFTEGNGGLFLTVGATVSDIDSADFNGGSLTVHFSANGTADDELLVFPTGTGPGQIGVSGSTVTYGGLTIGTVSGGTGGTDLVINFTTADATQAAVQALLQDLAYWNGSDDPSTATRTVSYTLVDGDGTANGGADTATGTSTVTVTAVNDTPTVTPSGGNAAWTEAGPAATIDASITLADPDNTTFASATVTIGTGYLTGHDVLAFTNGAGMGNISGSFNAATGTLTLTSSGATATVAQWEAALASVTFNSDSNSPGASRTISFQVNDGADDSNVGTKTIDITEVNSPPVVTTSGGSAAFVENSPAVVVDGSLTVTDPDTTTLDGATVHISTGFQTAEDILTYTPVGSITGSYNSATGTLTLSGTDTLANYQAVLESVKYNNTSDTPNTATRTLEFQLNDGQSVSNLSTIATRTVTVAATNDAPVVTAGQTLSYTENQAATAITTSITVSDVDSADFNGGSLTVAFTANGTSADQLAIANQGTGAGQIGVSGANVTYGGTIIGTYTGGTSGSDLVVSFNSSATAAAVQALARDITYANTSDAPSTNARTVTFTVVDGDGGTETGSGSATINVTAVNDAPVLANGAGTALAYTENDAPTLVNSGITVADVDSANLTGATVTISSNYQNGEDVLSAATGGTSITATFNAATGALTLSGTDTVAHYQTVLDSVTYVNTSENPSAATRTVSFEVDDGNASNHASNVVTRDIGVTPVNDAPVVSAGGTLAYTENNPATAINTSITLTDAEGDSITGAHAQITGNYVNGEDVLSFTPVGNITGSFNSTTGTLTLSGTDTAANYETALRSVTYANTSDNPSTAARTISFDATDSHGDPSTAATSTVTVAAVNDAPVNTVPLDSSVGTAFSNTAMSISGVSVADVDAGGGLMTVHVTAVSGGVTFSLAGGATVSAGTNGTADVTLSGNASQLNAALSTLSYKSNDGFTGSDTITVVTNDGGNTGGGGAKSDTDTFHVGVVPQVFIIDNTDATADTTTSGTAANPFNSIASFNANANDGSGDYIYINHGTGTYSEASGIGALSNNEQVYGQGQTLQFTNPVTGAIVTIGTGSVGNTPTISITGSSQTAITLAQNNTLKGFDIATTLGSQTAIADGGGTVGTTSGLTVNDVSISGTGMAVDIDQGGALNVTLDSLTSTGSSQQGVQLAGTLTGSFTATTGAISGSTGTGFLVGDGAGTANTGGTFTLNYGGTVSTTGTARAVDIQDRASGAGTVTFSGNVSHSGGNANGIFIDDIAGGAITFSGSNTLNTGTLAAIQATDVTGGSLTFSGNQDIDTTSGVGISLGTNSVATSFSGSQITVNTTSGNGVNIASNSGSVSFNNTGNGLDIVTTSGGTGLAAASSGTLNITGTSNTISSTNGAAVNLSSTTIGGSNVNFQSVSSSGAANGILLNNTGSTGSLIVTGSGTANSGGTISSTTGDGISVTGGQFNLGYMRVMNTTGHGINGADLVGTSTFSNGTISGWDTGNSFTKDGIHWIQTGSNAGSLNVTNDTISGAATANDGLYTEARGSGTMTLTVSGSTFTGLENDAIAVNGITGATSAMHVTIQNSQFTNSVASTGTGGVSLNPFGSVTLYADVNGNTFDSIMNPVNNLGAIGVTNGASADAEITIRNNTIKNIAGARGITVFADGGTNKYLISNNTIDNLGSSSKTGISVTFNKNTSTGTLGTGDVTVSNNQLGMHGTTAGVLWTSAVAANADAISVAAISGGTMTSSITGNTVSANTNFDDVIAYATLGGTQKVTVSGNTLTDTASPHTEITFQTDGTSTLFGSITGNTVPASGVGVITLQNAGTMNITQASAAAIASANNGATVTPSGAGTLNYGQSAPPAPGTPTLPLLAHGDALVQDPHTVTLDELGSIVAAAANRWAHLPLSAEQLTTLASLSFAIGHLAGDNVAAEAPGLIVIDDDAAGRGWFVDATPNDDSEFASAGSASHLYAVNAAAAQQIDLLTAVMHEIGHALGLSDTYADTDDLMYASLDAGVRRLPTDADVHVVGSVPMIQVFDGGGA